MVLTCFGMIFGLPQGIIIVYFVLTGMKNVSFKYNNLLFRYISKPRDVVREKSKRLEDQERAKTEVDRSFGTYGGGDLVYRERTINGGYRIRREKISVGSGVLSRGELLDRRLGKKSDKYC